jgi:hypothetical protein
LPGSGIGQGWLWVFDISTAFPSSSSPVDIQVNYTYDVLGNRIAESVSINGGTPTVTKFAYDQNGNAGADLNAGRDNQGYLHFVALPWHYSDLRRTVDQRSADHFTRLHRNGY